MQRAAGQLRTKSVKSAFFVLVLSLSLNAAPISVAPPAIVTDVTTGLPRPTVSAATNGSQFFVAWDEGTLYHWDGRLRFRTYDASGAPQQSLPLAMPGGASPSVAWTGGEWLVSWGRYVPPYTMVPPSPILFANRISTKGEVVADSLVLARSYSYNDVTTTAQWNGFAGLVAGSLTSTIVDADGRVVHALDAAYAPLAAMNGTFLVKLGDNLVALLDNSGKVLATAPVPNAVAAASHAGVYAIAQRTDAGLAVTHLQPNGTILDTTAYPAAPVLTTLTAASMTWSDGAFVVALAYGPQAGRLCIVRLEGSGKLDCLSEGYPVRSVSLAANDQKLLVAWSETHGATDRVQTAFLPGPVDVASVQRQPQNDPSMVPDANGETIVWSEPDAMPRVMLGGVNRNGTVRPPRVLGSPVAGPARIARGNDRAIAVWSTGGPSAQIYGREIFDDGTLAPAFLLAEGTDPSIAFNGQNWVLAWRSNAVHIMASYVDVQIHWVLWPLELANPGTSPAIASRGNDFLVAWVSCAIHCAADGVLLDRYGFVASPVTELAPGYFTSPPAIAGSGDLYLLGLPIYQTKVSALPTTLPGVMIVGYLARVHPRAGGGFAALWGNWGSRFLGINALGDVTSDMTLPLFAKDFVEKDGRIDVVYGDGEVLFDSFALKRRAVGMR